MSIVINARGTSVPYFKIGKSGATIYQGSTDPSLTYTLYNGDFWLNTSTTALQLWDSTVSSWKAPQLANLNFVDNTIIASSASDLTLRTDSGNSFVLDSGTLTATLTTTVGDNLSINESIGGSLYLNSIKWPSADGTNGQVLITDGAGIASFGPIIPAMAPDLAVDADVVHIAGDSMTGSLSLPKTKGYGLLIDNGFSWGDIIGSINPKTMGTTAAEFKEFRGQTNSWAHYAGSYGDLIYHLPHEYAPGTNLFFHIHWGHNGTSIEGNFIIKCWVTYAKRTYPASPYSAPIETSIVVNSANITDYPQYAHSVIEIQLSTIGGAINMLDTNEIETDGVILVRYEIDTIPSIGGSTVDNVPYIQTFDIHYQSTSVGTKNKDPNFWA